jgi:hypothetical protein
MSKAIKPPRKEVDDFMEKMKAEAASEGKTLDVFLARRSKGMKDIIIRMHKQIIQELKEVKSLDE